MKVYKFTHDDLPFQLSTGLRFLCKSTVARHQHTRGITVSFGHNTRIQMVVPSDPAILPYITASCPDSGSILRLNVHVQPERGLTCSSDAKAYLRRVMCIEAVSICQKDLSNALKHGSRAHYTPEFFREQIEKYQHRADTFYKYDMSAQYD